MSVSAATAVFIKKAALMGLVCTPVSVATYVAHKPISKMVNKVTHRAKPKAVKKKTHHRAIRPLAAQAICPPSGGLVGYSVPMTPIADVPATFTATQDVPNQSVPNTGGFYPGYGFPGTPGGGGGGFYPYNPGTPETPVTPGTPGTDTPGVPGTPGTDTPTTPPIAAPVPEPATWMMVISGVGLVGGAARYRRRKLAHA
jgi:hypothetical protein